MARDIPRFISVDDHVVEPAHLFQRWLPKQYADDPRSPRVERRGIGKMEYKGGTTYEIEWDDTQPKSDTWFYEDLVAPHKRHVASVGFPRDEMTLSPITYDEMRPGCYDPKARLEDMDVDHVEASLCFPTFPRFCGQTFSEAKDKDLAWACVRAYNDWMVEEWCGDSGGRLIPLCLVPLWDVELAAAEVRRNAARGVTAVAFSEIPSKLGLPTLHSGYWEPFFEACAETETLVCMHIGSSSQMPATSPDAPAAVGDAQLRQRDVVDDRLPVLRRAGAPPAAEARVQRRPDRLDPLHPRTRRRRVGRAPGVGWRAGRDDRAAVVLLPPPDLRLLLPRPSRARVAAPDRRRQRHLRDRLPAHRLHLAAHQKLFEEQVADLDDATVYKIARGNAIRMLRLPLEH